MATPRFHIPPADWNLENLLLTGEESHHCAEVMRAKPGDRIVVFDGQGTEAEVRVSAISGKSVSLEPLMVQKTPAPPATLVLAQAVPKGKNMDLIVQKATELGVSRIVPLLSERTVVRVDKEDLDRKREKWQRTVLEACKQCGQNWLPTVETPATVDAFAKRAGSGFRLVAAIGQGERGLKPILADHETEHGKRPSEATIMIGPEGDFTPAEVATAVSAGFSPLSLGPIILRSETAAIYALSIVGHELMGDR